MTEDGTTGTTGDGDAPQPTPDGAPTPGWTPPVAPVPPTDPFAAAPPAAAPWDAAPPPTAWSPYASPEPPRPTRRWPWVAGAIAFVLVGALVLVGGWVLLARVGSGLSDTAFGPQGPGDTWVGDLKVGDCYLLDSQDRRDDVAGYVAVTPCTVPHDGEVFAVVSLDFDAWPGAREAGAAADKGCSELFDVLDEAIYDVASIGPSSYYPDTEESWDSEEHTVQCVVESDEALGLTRSWRVGSSASASASA